MNLSITRRAFLAGVGAAAGLNSRAFAQGLDKYLRIILPVGAGSGVDAIARTMGTGLSKALEQQVVIENLPGAGGVLGTTQLVKAPKDGQTIAIVSNNHVINPSLYPNIPFDPLEDITPISILGGTPMLLIAHPSVGVSNLSEFLRLARANPGKLNYGSAGNGTILHLAGALLASDTKINVQHVPYRSSGQLMQDLLGGQIQVAFFAASVAAPHVQAGSLRALGISTASRSPQLPDVPTIAEQGVAGYALEGWFAAIGPAKLPQAEVTRLHAGLVKALTMPEVKNALVNQGNTVNPTTPADADRFLRSEYDRYTRVVKEAGIKLD